MTAGAVAGRLGPFDPPRPRRPPLDFAMPCAPDWLSSSLPVSCLLNAYSIVFPALETAMVTHIAQSVGTEAAAAGAVDAAAVRGFLQQEGSHAREHRRSLDCLRAQGYDIDAATRRAEKVVSLAVDGGLRRILRPVLGDAFAVGIFAGAEHWTAVLSEWSLAGSPTVRVGRPGDTELSEMEILYLWHIAEELEHKAVVADVFSGLGGGEVARVVSFLFATPVFLLLTGLTFGALARQTPRVLGPDAWAELGGWRGYLRTVRRDLGSFPGLHRRAIRQYLRRGFHPNDQDTEDLVRQAFDRLQALRDVRVV